MDKIYSRKRIKFPKVIKFNSDNKRTKKFLRIIVIFVIAITTFYIILRSVTPIFEGLCIAKAMNLATTILNTEKNKVLSNANYSDIVKIEKDNDANIVKTDVATINKISSEIALATEKSLQEIENERINIPIGSLTGNKYLVGAGPSIKIKVIPVGTIATEIKTEFESQGINQTIYRIYLELKCNVNILMPYNTISKEIVNQVLLVETVIVGNVPQTYYNLEDLNKNNAIDIIE